jgi:methylglutaconyl-CoA hydratase
MNRPPANAMGRAFVGEFVAALDQLKTSPTRCLILTSHSSKVFSAGADLKERRGMGLDETEAFVSKLRDTFEDFANLPMPTIAAMEGVAVGGGLELALAADMRIASSTATLGLPETSLAIVPGAGGTQRLARLIGLARAKEMIYTARRIDGITASDYGLTMQAEPGKTLSAAIDMAWKIAANGPVAVRAAKFAMNHGMTHSSWLGALAMEKKAYETVLPTEDRIEGLNAFTEGRKPNYSGR